MKRLAVYLVVTFGLTWGLLIPAGIALGAFERGEYAVPIMLTLLGVCMFFPLAGALVANFTGKPKERIDLCYKPRIRGNVRYYLVAWLVPALLSAAGIALFFVLNPQWFDPTMESYLAMLAEMTGMPLDQLGVTKPDAAALVGIVVSAVLVAPFINAIPAFGEELGWRGMLLPTLCGRMSERAAVLVSGVIWGLWHAPAIAMGHNYGTAYAGFPIAGILVMIVACVAFGSFLSWLRLRTNSVWPCALAHGAVNAVANIGLVFCAAGQTLFGPTPLGLLAGIPTFVLAVVCLLNLRRA